MNEVIVAGLTVSVSAFSSVSVVQEWVDFEFFCRASIDCDSSTGDLIRFLPART